MIDSMTGYKGLGEAAAELGLRPHQLAYLHAARLVPEPPRLFGKRCYDAAFMSMLREYVCGRGLSQRSRPAAPLTKGVPNARRE